MAGTGDKLLTAAEIKEVTDTKVDKDFSALTELPNGLSDTDLINVRRSGSNYKLTGADLAPTPLGETSSTAYRGDRGKAAYDHATAKGSAFSSGLYKITTNAEGHVTAATSVAKADITGLGIPGSDTNTHRPIQVNGTEILGNNTTALNLKAGSNVTLTNSSGTVTVAATDTTYSSKSAASGGTAVSLVTTGEKYTWNNKSNLAIGTTSTTAAAGNHTHTLSLATNSGTSKISLAANTKYQLTAGGSTYIFTTPPDANTWRGIQNNLTSTSTTDSLSAYQGKILNDKLPITYALYNGYLQSSKTAGSTNVTVISGSTSMAAGTYIVFLKMITVQATGSGTVTVKLGSKSFTYTVSTFGTNFSDTYIGIINGLTAGNTSWSVVINGGANTMEVVGFNTIALNAVRLVG